MTGSSSGDHLGQGLVHKACVPISCEVIDSFPSGSGYISIQSDNEEVLHAIMMLEDAPRENPDDSSTEGQEIQRLETKINLMFELLAGLYRNELELPAPVDIALRSDAVEWQASESNLTRDTLVRLKLYLSNKYPKPVVLHGRITSSEDTTCVVFDDAVSERCRDWIDKYIFRHHRRAVAMAKRESSTEV